VGCSGARCRFMRLLWVTVEQRVDVHVGHSGEKSGFLRLYVGHSGAKSGCTWVIVEQRVDVHGSQ
jgi:hypothetical protein